MTALVQTDDFETAGLLAFPPWTYISGNYFTSDGLRAYPTVFNADNQMTMNAAQPTLSTASPRAMLIEVDVQWPSTLPAAPNNLRLGICALQKVSGRSGLWFLLERLNGGATNQIKLLVAGATSATDVTLTTSSFTLAASAQARLSLLLQFNANTVSGAFQCLSLTNSAAGTITGLPIATFNSITGGVSATPDAMPKYVGLFGRVDGANGANNEGRAYFDTFRVRDYNQAANLPDLHPEYTLASTVTLTPITPSAEDNSTGDTLTVHPDWAVEIQDRFEGVEFQSDAGHVVVHATQRRKRRSWGFHWDARSATDIGTLRSLCASVYGTTKALSWTDPETGSATTVRFTSELQTAMTSPGVYSAEVNAEEIFA